MEERERGLLGIVGAEVLLHMWFFGNWCKAWGKKAGENVKKWKAVVEEVSQSFDDMVLSKSTKWPRITRLLRRRKNS
jgi:hypothetical protein